MVSGEIDAFCKGISPEVPFFVPVRPHENAEPNQCFWNVKDAVLELGGAPIFGWAIWEWKSVYLEAQYHAVLKLPSDECIDVTPLDACDERVLFLPDPKAKFFYNNPKWRDSHRKSLSENVEVDAFLRAASKVQRFELRHSEVQGRDRLIRIPASRQRIWDKLRKEQKKAADTMMRVLECA